MLNRRTLDVAIPMVFGIAIAALAMTTDGSVVGVFAVIGGGLVGIYFAALRQNLPAE